MSSEEKKIIFSPVRDERSLEELRVGDIIYVSGVMVTARDEAHKRVVEKDILPPVDLRGYAIFHAGPIMMRTGDMWRCVSIGPTTSRRMEYYEDRFIEKTGVKIVVGKGGMGQRTAEACKKFKAIYAIFPGGCGVLGASRVVRVRGVEWLELGMPEALWVLEVREFGPLIVSIDTRGENLADSNLERVRRAKEEIVRETIERIKILKL